MKRHVFIILVLGSAVLLAGCGKKQQTLEEMQEPLSMEALSAVNTSAPTAAVEVKVTEPAMQANEPQKQQAALEPLPPTVTKPTVTEIQTALKNAGFYAGVVDGKSGAMTKKAIEEFQKANNLQVDGKVGPKTWVVLGAYLNPPVDAKAKAKKKR